MIVGLGTQFSNNVIITRNEKIYVPWDTCQWLYWGCHHNTEHLLAMLLQVTEIFLHQGSNIRFYHPNNSSLIITIIIVSILLYREIWNMTLLQHRSNSSNIFNNSKFIFNLKPTLRSCTRCCRELKETEFFSHREHTNQAFSCNSL